MGHLDPYWAILSRPGTKFRKWDTAEFFATGEVEISTLMNKLGAFGLPVERKLALDFGCGVGRLTHALSRYFDRCLGIDISQSMIRQAEQLCASSSCEFLLHCSDALPFPDGYFDLIYTALVLQHVPQQKTIRTYISEFCRTLKPGGILVMQLPSYVPIRRRLQARPRIYRWLRKFGVPATFLFELLGLHPIPMNYLSEAEVVSIVRRARATIRQTEVDDRAGPHISSRTYYVTKQPSENFL